MYIAFDVTNQSHDTGRGQPGDRDGADNQLLTVRMPRRRMSFDEAPIMIVKSPGSTTVCRFLSNIDSMTGVTANFTTCVSPGCK